MKLAWSGFLLLTALPLAGGTQDSELNVNTRYTVETVAVRGDGWTFDAASDRNQERISPGLRRQIAQLIGDKLNPAVLDELAGRLRQEFQARTVAHRVLRGTSPEYVQVLFEIQLRPTRFDVSVPKFAYTPAEGFSGAVEATATVERRHGFTLGLVSDGDDLVERYSGVVARYENTHLGSERVRGAVQFASYREQWNSATQEAGAGLYRSRDGIEPSVTFVLARPLTLTLGAGFTRLQNAGGAGETEAANVLTSALSYHRQLEEATLDGGYNLRAATRVLGSDFVYLRHHWMLRYALRRGKHALTDRMIAGMLVGRAPLFERYVLGNSTTLRGWNKYEVGPLGGNRVVHNSVEYRYGWFEGFYDSGAIWDSGQPFTLRHSIGLGVHQGPVFWAVAFPMRSGKVEPIFMVSMNY